jgi:hypothetical protein
VRKEMTSKTYRKEGLGAYQNGSGRLIQPFSRETESVDWLPIKGYVWAFTRPSSDLPPEAGLWTLRCETPNLIVTTGKVLVAGMLANEEDFKTGVTFGEVGTGTTAPVLSDTTLEAVTHRNPISRYVRSANRVQFRVFFAASDVAVHIREMGLFGHSTATSTEGSGLMLNRALLDLNNSSGSKDLTLVAEIKFG